MGTRKPSGTIKGRGAASSMHGRFEVQTVTEEHDGWDISDDPDFAPSKLSTTVQEERARTIITRNSSPDLGFSQSINPFRGCEHGCIYCFARPSHSYLNLSPGLDFETKLFAKTNAPELLRAELAKPGYKVAPIALGINTDAYQPIERTYRITRSLLEVFAEHSHPVSFVTKWALILRDLDVLSGMSAKGLVNVHVSVTTLDNRLSSRMEPRATAPHARLDTIAKLADAGVPVGVLIAPIIPMITDSELERILEAARSAGAMSAGYVLLRLPHELKEIWREWLRLHFPDRAAHVMSLMRQMHGGKDYDSSFGARMRGTGPFAELIGQRFKKAKQRLGYGALPELDCARFSQPQAPGPQGSLF
jgi:DNA repair photolyase